MSPPNSYAVKWKWGVYARIQEIYASQIMMMNVDNKDQLIQSMQDSPVYTVAQGEFMQQLFLEIGEGVTEGSLECGWHRTPAYITILLQCTACHWTAGAEIYTRSQANIGVTQEDYRTLHCLLTAMVGINVGPNQGV